jgi:hypothetical protein
MEVFVARGDGIAEGIYRPSGVGFHFPAGSYSVYGNFRGGLAKLVGTTSAQAWKANGGPFWEIFKFAEFEGFLGPKTSAKLAEDFDQHHDAAVKAWSSDPRVLWRVRVYESFLRAFKTAAGTGVVYFG